MTTANKFADLGRFCMTGDFTNVGKVRAAAVAKVIACRCIDDLPESVIDRAVRFLDAVASGELCKAGVTPAIRKQATELLDRICA